MAEARVAPAGLRSLPGSGERGWRRCLALLGEVGYTVIELLIALALLATIASILIPMTFRALHNAKVAEAVTDLRMIADQLELHEIEFGEYPDDLTAIGGPFEDPWGNDYRYVKFPDQGYQGVARHDQANVPINDHFDLYSLGRDGTTHASQATHPQSHDDVYYAYNGKFIGLGSDL